MMEKLCLVYLLSIFVSVSTNPLGQLLQSCNVCQPSSYSNPPSIPVVIQQPSNTNPYPGANTAQIPAAFSGPLGDTLNQVLLNKILGNPSLQKIIDPNTKLVNQNGEAVPRQVPNTGVPNVINNYFIVPPEFFNINETVSNNDEEFLVEKVRRPTRRKVKKKLRKVQPSPKDDESKSRKVASKRRNQKELETLKRTRIYEDDSVKIPKVNELQEASRKVEDRKRMHRPKTEPPPIEDSEEDEYLEWEDLSPVVDRGDTIKVSKKSKPKPINADDESNEIVNEAPKSKTFKDKFPSRVAEEDIDNEIEISQSKRSKKSQRKEISDKRQDKLDDTVLKNIEIPTDVSNRVSSENRKTRDSKRNGSKRDHEQRQMSRKEPSNMTPFPDEVLNNFFPYMPMGNHYNPNSNYPYNFNQYYQYLDPARNNDANTNKRRRKNQNRKNSQPSSKTHTIEIKLKPKKKDNSTEAVTTETPKDVEDITVSIEVDQSTESIEQITAIPMEVPQKVSLANTDDEDSAESYETFSKLEDLHEFITPELGNEDEVHPMANNGIINDYYPVFDDDVHYPHVEKVRNLEDNRYYYETGNEDKATKDKRMFDRYEELRSYKRDTKNKESENIDNKSKKVSKLDPDMNKYDQHEYLDHISTFSDSAEHETVKSDDEIRRVKVPPKNTRVKSEIVETVSAGSKVVKYGIPSDEIVEDTSSYTNSDDNTDVGTTYIVAKSLGKPEDYY